MGALNNDNYRVSIYWTEKPQVFTNSRQQQQQYVIKIIETFRTLSKYDESLVDWFVTSRPKKGREVKPIEITEGGILDLLDKGSHVDNDSNLLPELGYLLYLKSEKAFEKANVLSISCGGVSSSSLNSVILEIEETKVNLQNIDILKDIFNELIRIWNPDNGRIFKPSMDSSLACITFQR